MPGDLADRRRQLIERRLRGAGAARPAAGGDARRQGQGAGLSSAQERLWFLDRLVPGSPVCNVTTLHRLRGPLDVSLLRRSLTEIVRRHEALRTVFGLVDGRPVPLVQPPEPVRVDLVDLSGDADRDAERRARALVADEARRPFDLGAGPLLRAALVRLRTDEHQLVLTIHHIASDGWSAELLTRELSELYQASCEGRPAALAVLEAQYADYVRRERDWLSGAEPRRQLRYWRECLGPDPEELDFPWDHPRPPLLTFRGGRVRRRLAPALHRQLEALGRSQGATLFVTLLTGFLWLLHRHTGHRRIAVGTPVARRDRREFEALIGLFLNTLVLRPDLSGEPSFTELIQRVRQVVLGAYEHQELPFERLVQELAPSRDLSRNPLFQAMFLLRHGPPAALRLADLEVTSEDVENGTAKFDLTLAMETSPAGLVASLEYNADLLQRVSAERLLERLERLLLGMVRRPNAPAGQAELLAPEERRRLTADSIGPAPPELLHELVETQARRRPEAPAVICEGEELTYADLNGRANALARVLRAGGIGPERLAGLLLSRSPAMVVAQLAVLKAGAAYVVLDPDHPDRRLGQMLTDSGASVVLTERSLRHRLPPAPVTVLCLDEDRSAIERESHADLERLATPLNLAYLTYTSGTTGRPKGVMGLHVGAVNWLAFGTGAYGLGEDDVVLQLASPSFDASVRDTLGPLTAGARVVLGPGAGDPDEVLRTIERHRVTCLLGAVPSVLKALLTRIGDGPHRCPSLRLLLVSGETLGWPLASRLPEVLGTGLRVVNLYGPTECTMTCVHHTVDEAEPSGASVPIGQAIANIRLYVLDERLSLVPPGIPGELYIAGAGVSRGYHRRPGLTAGRFLPDPFDARPGSRMYRTGDRVRQVPGGPLLHLGRLDRQVKVRGVRVEPEEVEAVLGEHPSVRDASVTAMTGSEGEQGLVAHVACPGRQVAAVELRSFLAARLPAQSVPSLYVLLDALPLTPNGKVDRSRLPRPEPRAPAGRRPGEEPRDVLELTMVQLWEEILGRRPIGTLDDFFTVGGHSLKAVVLVDGIRRRFGVDLPIAAVFRSPSVAGLCELIRTGGRAWAGGCLVQLQAGTGGEAPLFLVHPQSGDIACYLPLSRALGPAPSIYGVQAVGLSGDEAPLGSMEAMVDRYVAEIRRVEPHGPYRLVGWSFGGSLAFELARRLESTGAEVAFLGLLDARALRSPAPPATEPAMARVTPLPLEHGGAEIEAGEPGAGETAVGLLRREAELRGAPRSSNTEVMRRLSRVFELNGAIGERHMLTGTVRADLHLYLARERAVALPTPEVDAEAWRPLTEGRLWVSRVPGSHYDLVASANVRVLASALRRALAGVPDRTMRTMEHRDCGASGRGGRRGER